MTPRKQIARFNGQRLHQRPALSLIAGCLLCLCLLFTPGHSESHGEMEGGLDAERQALMEADAAWFKSHTNIDQFVSFLTDDAVFMPEGAPASRGDAIRAAWEQLLAMPGFDLKWQANSAHVASSGDMGYTLGTYELVTEQKGTLMVTKGKYVTVWEKQDDGSWKVAVDCFNSNGPPTAVSAEK